MRALRRLTDFVRPFMWPLLLAIALTGSLSLVGMVPPLLMRVLINDVAGEGKWDLFPVLMVSLFSIPLLRASINVVNSLALRNVGLGIIAKTRRRVFRRLLRLSLRFHSEMSPGAASQRLMGDVATISNVATGGIVMLATDAISVVFAVVVMLKLNLSLTCLTFALLPLYYMNYRLFAGRIRENSAVLRLHMDHISTSLQERLSAHDLIQTYGQEDAESVHFSSRARQVMDAAIRGAAYNASFGHLSDFINKIGNTLIYCGACYYLIGGRMGYGDVVAFCAYATQLLGPIVRLSNVSGQLVQAGVAIDRIDQVLDCESDVVDALGVEPVDSIRGDVRINDLSFSHTGGRPALQDVDLVIPEATRLAVVGAPGSGRTTLAMLLRRYFDPSDGQIEVDGRDIRHYRLRDYRRDLAMVSSDSGLFDGTIRENLLYGAPEASDARMEQVARALGLHEFVERLKNGYSTRIGSTGLRLSSGNRQRIGIARALLSDPSILILDEATAPLDPNSAHEALEAISDYMRGRTQIAIVHRVLMARDADLIIVMDEGRIVEQGRHEELLRRPEGLYRTLFARQYGVDRLPPIDGERLP